MRERRARTPHVKQELVGHARPPCGESVSKLANHCAREATGKHNCAFAAERWGLFALPHACRRQGEEGDEHSDQDSDFD